MSERKECVLAIDCGTQSLRALVFDAEGELLFKKKVEYEPYFSVKPGWAEQDAEQYWKALKEAVGALSQDRPDLLKALKGMGVTTLRDSFVTLDADGNPLRPVIVWLDLRKAKPPYVPKGPVKLVLSAVGMGEAVIRTQEDGKMNWVRENEPDIWKKTAKIGLVSGFLQRRLTGEFIDSTAAQVGHIPFDYKKQKWAPVGHLNRKFFPADDSMLFDLVPPGASSGKVCAKAASETGLPEGLEVIAC